MFSLKEAISSTPQHPKSLCDNKLKRAGGELRPFDYDHEGGRPIFRALATKSLDPIKLKWSTRLEVTECRFGPIPESEFAPESFLGHLEPDGIIREHVEGSSIAMLFDGYWLAFLVGGMSLAGGAGLALGSRDRRVLRADRGRLAV